MVSTRIEIFDYVRPTEERRRHGPDIAPELYNDRVVIAYTVVPGPRCVKVSSSPFRGLRPRR